MSKKHAKNNSLSEKLSSLILAKPSLVESEDEDIATVDKITAPENDSDFSADELDIPKFRKLNNQLLEEDDAKYSGKGVSRKDLRDSDSDIAEDEAFEEEENDDDEEEPEGEDLDSEENEEEEDYASEAEDSTEENAPENKSKKEVPRNKPKVLKNNKDALNPEMISKAVDDIEKGKGIKNQLHIWDFLLECRMKFQKSLDAANQMPSFKNFQKFSEAGGQEFQHSVSETKKSIEKMLKSFLNLQQGLLELNEDYGTSKFSEKSQDGDCDSDSEISSDSESEQTVQKKPVEKKLKRKLKDIKDFSEEISKRHQEFETYRNNIIQKWNDKTRFGYISSKNFSAFELPTLKQIEHVLLDNDRLIKKTQTKRSIYHILGEEDEPSQKISKFDSEISLASKDKNKSLCKEIFDDNDFYHQLLSELVKKKSVEITDPVQLGRHWLQLQKIRSKLKKVVDTKASKGRKIRYVVHPKLVNFMMPVDNSVYNEESRAELFNSLFGKK